MTNHATTTEVPVRLDFDTHAPAFARAMGRLDRAATEELDRVGFDPRVRELVRIRASQLNGCAYCIDMHTKDARAIGETEQRIFALPAWKETPFFTARERAALAFTEAVTLLADDHVPSEAYEAVADHFTPDEVAALVCLIVTINAWNGISVSTRAWVPVRTGSRSAALSTSRGPRGAITLGSMDSRRVAFRRIAVYAAVVGIVFAVAFLTGSLPSPGEARDWGEGLGDFAYVAFVPLFVVLNFIVTWPILAGAAGLLFGTAAGTPLVLAGVTCASLTQMFVARRLALGHHGNLLPKRTKAVEDFLTRHGAVAVMESRIVPLLPWGLVNYSAGLTRLQYRDLAVGTLIGGAPKVFAYTALGGSLDNLASPEALIAVALLATLALAGALFVRRQIALGRAA